MTPQLFVSAGHLSGSSPCCSNHSHLPLIPNLHFSYIRSNVILLSFPWSTNPYGSLYPLSCSFRRPLFIHSYGIFPPSYCIYRVSQEERAKLRESVPYVKLYRYTPKHLCPKLNGYGDKGKRKVWSSCGYTYCTWLA
jgi:hypothetical protein